MKLPRLLNWFLPLLSLALSTSLHAIDITAVATPDPFPAVPAVTDWSTGTVAGASTAQTADEMDVTIIATIDAATIATELPATPTTPPSNNGLARWNDGTGNDGNSFLQTRPTGVVYTLLLAHLTNATGGPLSSIGVAYDYSTATNTIVESVEGLRAYWSIDGLPGSWTKINEFSVDTAGTLAAPQAVSATITLPAALPAGGTMFLLWADQNSVPNPDASYHIDNFAVSVGGAPTCAITGTIANVQRSPGVDPANPADDTVSFSATVTGTGPLSPSGYRVSAPAGLVGNAGVYNTPQTFSAVPVSNFTSGTLLLTVQDADAGATCQTTLTVRTSPVIGTNEVAGTPILTDGATVNSWVFDEAQRTSTQTGAAQGDNAVTSQIINLASTGEVLLRADLDATTGASSGFELPDGFAMEVIIDGGAPVSVLGLADVDNSGRLNGANAAGGQELPDATVPNYTQTFSFYALIPATANQVQIRFIGNSNSPNETFVVKNLRLSNPAPFIFVSTGGRPTLDNKGTTTAADDEFSALLNVQNVSFTGTNWLSDEVPPNTGAYAVNPDLFGPYPVSGGPKTVTLRDQTNPAITSPPYTIPLPPPATLAATAPANISTNPDGTVTFQSTVTSGNGGPSFTVTGATASRNTYGAAPVTFTIPAPLPASPIMVTITDASYPAATQTLSVTVTAVYTIGQTNLGGGLQDLFSSSSDPLWVNDPGLRTLTMNTGAAADSIVASQLIDLSTVGAVTFSARFNAAEISIGSNFEVGDRFKAELVIDAGLPTESIINLVDGWDVGNGANSTAVATAGLNGPKNGYINGYNGTAGLDLVSNTTYATGAEEYNANKARDEFNTDGETVDISINNDFILNYSIPSAASSVRLILYGAGFAGSETATVSDVLFTTGAVSNDTDGDGVSNTDEVTMGTDPNNAADVLRISRDSSNPNVFTFPTKSGRFYKVYSSTDLLAWSPTTIPTIVGDGTTKSFDITPLIAQGRRFFRLHVRDTDGPWN